MSEVIVVVVSTLTAAVTVTTGLEAMFTREPAPPLVLVDEVNVFAPTVVPAVAL